MLKAALVLGIPFISMTAVGASEVDVLPRVEREAVEPCLNRSLILPALRLAALVLNVRKFPFLEATP